MIPISEISRKAMEYGVPADTVEKDYMISWILQCISKTKLTSEHIFRGGTAIKRIFFEDHRYSEDIDFLSHTPLNHDHILDEMQCLNYAKNQANISLSVDQSRIEKHQDRFLFYITYSGFDEIVGPPKEIKIDFCFDSEKFEITEQKNIISTYSDFSESSLPITVMSLNSILANKLGMLSDLTRNEPRDIYDIWFLLKRTAQFKIDCDEITKMFKQKYGYKPRANQFSSILDSNSIKEKWEFRLRHQVSNLPDYKIVARESMDILKHFLGTTI